MNEAQVVFVVVWQDTEARGEQEAQAHGVYRLREMAVRAIEEYARDTDETLVWADADTAILDDLFRMTISAHTLV